MSLAALLDKDVQRLRRARRQPRLHFTSADLPKMMEQICASLFPDVPPIPVYFVSEGSLACITTPSEPAERDIYLHEVLNTAETPDWVFRAIFVHELIHVGVPSEWIGDRWVSHPPAFCKRERELVPEMERVWEWLNDRLWVVLRIDRKKERTRVVRDWARQLGRGRSPREARLRLWLHSPDTRRWIEEREDQRRGDAAAGRPPRSLLAPIRAQEE